MSKTKQIGFFVIMIMCLLCICGSNAYAGEVIIDGQYDDWNEANMDSLESLFLSKVEMVTDDENLYIYVRENADDPWENYFSYMDPIITTKSGVEIPLAIYAGDSADNGMQLSVVNRNGNASIEGAEAYRTKDSTYRFEMKLPLSSIGNVESVSLKVNYNDRIEFVPKVLEEVVEDDTTQPAEPETEVETEAESEDATENSSVDNIVDDNSGIIIDGSFADWESYPHVLDTNWNMPESQRTKDNCRTLGIYSDGEYLYIHIIMIHGWNDPFNSNYFNIIAAGEQVDVYLYTEDGIEVQNVNFEDGIHDFILHYHHGTPGMSDATPIEGAEACFVRMDGKPDEIEVKIPLEIFTIVHGIDVEDIKEIQVKNPSLFDQGMTIAGSSSMPFLGIAICIASVAGGTLIYRRKKITLSREK